MKFLKRLLAGMAIGVGAAIPGVSGAAVAVVFHVYEEVIDAVNNIRKKVGYAIKVLIPILLGAVIALLPCIYLFSLAFEHMMFVLMSIFVGFLLGSLPSITDEVKGHKPTKKQWVVVIIGILFVISLGVLSIFLGPNIKMDSQFDVMPLWLYLVLIPVGAVAAVALTVPGLSGSLILLVIGFYRPLIDHVKNWGVEALKGDWSHFGMLAGTILCFGVGCIIGIVFVSKVMSYLLAKHRITTYFGIIGFIIGSLFVLHFNYEIYNYYLNWAGQDFPNINPVLPMYLEIILGIAALILATLGSYQIVKYQRKMHLESQAEETK